MVLRWVVVLGSSEVKPDDPAVLEADGEARKAQRGGWVNVA